MLPPQLVYDAAAKKKLVREALRRSPERELSFDNRLVRIHLIVVMIWWTGLAPWEFEFPSPGSLISTFLVLSL